jgi:hypothetical protein
MCKLQRSEVTGRLNKAVLVIAGVASALVLSAPVALAIQQAQAGSAEISTVAYVHREGAQVRI